MLDQGEGPIERDPRDPIRLPGGPLLGIVLVFRDFSAQRKAQKTSAHLAAIIEFSGDAIFTKDLDGSIQTWNAGAERLLGYREEEVLGKSGSHFFSPEDAAGGKLEKELAAANQMVAPSDSA